MNKRSHKIIWRITLIIVVMAIVVQQLLSALHIRAEQEKLRDISINYMIDLLSTDWRLRRQPTRLQVELVAEFSENPKLDSAETYFAQGLFRFYARSNNEAAEESFRQSIALNPQWAWSHDLLGIVLFRMGDHEAGAASIERAMELEPDWSRPYSDLARLYRLERQWDKALEYAQTAIDMDTDNPIPLFNYGVIMDKMGDRIIAQQIYRKVLKIDAELPAPYYNIACHYARNGMAEDAMQHLKIAITLGPQFYREAQMDSDFDAMREDRAFKVFMKENHPENSR